MIDYETHPSPFKIFFGSNINFLPHMHQEIEIIYMKKGSLLVTIQHTTYTINGSDLALIMPHTLHSYKTPESSEFIILIFKQDFIPYYQSVMTQLCSTPIIRNDALHPDINTYFDQLLLDETKSEVGLIKGYLYLLFTRILPHLHFTKVHHSEHQDLIYKCLHYIHLHFKEPLSLDTMAQHLGVSPYSISRVFNKSIGYSFSYYINTLSIDYAKYLLRETNLSITEISFECGYETIRHFNRMFKDLTSVSPHSYKLQLATTPLLNASNKKSSTCFISP